MKEIKNLLVAVSGGRSSAFMAYHIHNNEKYKDYQKIYVFANTGMERPETIQFLNEIEKNWNIPLIKIEGVYNDSISYKIVDYDNLDMKAETFSNAIKYRSKGEYFGLPNMGAPYCSETLKVVPSKKIANDIFGKNNFLTAIGYRFEDMPKRISFAEIKSEKKKIFPLITDFEKPINLHDLEKFWATQNFKLKIPSSLGNCELCWKKSDKKLVQAIRSEIGRAHV